jgi:predicted deacylase
VGRAFPATYEASRARFLHDAEALRGRWPRMRLESHPLNDFPELSIDWLWAEPPRRERLVVISTAQHGVEGYVGSAMLKLFMQEFTPRLEAENTGLLLIHAINPWGMQHRRRVNPRNVDLNRNFVLDGVYSREINRDYELVADLLNPRRPVRRLRAEAPAFLLRVLAKMLRHGRKRLQAATLLGQHRHPEGIYFGGNEVQEETRVLMGLYRRALEQYQSVLQIDLHSGYGPRYQMTVLIPPFHPTTSAEAARKFKYPRVRRIDAAELYAISGDMGEYVYRLRDAEFATTKVLACGFEFGTFGDALPALIRSLRASVLEGQMRAHGAVDAQAEAEVRAEYGELFLPTEAAWREKALVDCRQALEGILVAQGLV